MNKRGVAVEKMIQDIIKVLHRCRDGGGGSFYQGSYSAGGGEVWTEKWRHREDDVKRRTGQLTKALQGYSGTVLKTRKPWHGSLSIVLTFLQHISLKKIKSD